VDIVLHRQATVSQFPGIIRHDDVDGRAAGKKEVGARQVVVAESGEVDLFFIFAQRDDVFQDQGVRTFIDKLKTVLSSFLRMVQGLYLDFQPGEL
jgi:hypothetical protein